MFGIYGINKKQPKEKLNAILKLSDFRGSDFTVVSISDNYSFGHNRLAIICDMCTDSISSSLIMVVANKFKKFENNK